MKKYSTPIAEVLAAMADVITASIESEGTVPTMTWEEFVEKSAF